MSSELLIHDAIYKDVYHGFCTKNEPEKLNCELKYENLLLNQKDIYHIGKNQPWS